MAVYVDTLRGTTPRKGWRFKYSSHLTADSLEELHEFAEALGLKREWFQDESRFPHYDITAGKYRQAIRMGAKVESTVEAVRRMRGKA